MGDKRCAVLHMSRIWTHVKKVSKKWCEGEDACASYLPKQSVMALPTKRLNINGVFQDVLIDSGCTCCIIPHGPIKGLVPIMAVVQQNKGKVRPVLDFRELNMFIEAFTANTDACADKL